MSFTPHSKKVNREVANFDFKQRPVVCFCLSAFLNLLGISTSLSRAPFPQRLSTAQRGLGQLTGEKPRTNGQLSLAAWAWVGEHAP